MIRIIKDHTRGLSIVGIPLSGGLDSSTITALAVKKFKPINGKIISVSSVLDPKLINEGESDEMNYILELVKNETIIEPKFVYHSDLNFHNELLSNFEKQYSVLNSNYCLDEAIFKQLKLNNVRRVLSGIFGDYTATNRVINPYPYLILHCKIFSVNKLLVSEANNSGIPLSSLIKSKILIPFIPFSLLKFIYKIKGRKIVWGTKEIDLIPDSKEKKDLQRRILKSFKKIYHEESSITNKIWPTDHEPFYEEWDCGSSYYQLEITYPLADRRLVELLLRLPADHFMADGSVRGLIRKTMEGILPEKIRKRTDKITYSPGFHTIFRKEFQVFFLNLVKLELNRPTVPMIQISKFTEKLKDLINSERSIKFAGDYWVIIHLYIWLVFSHWIDNIQNIKHETQGKKKLD
ncbi:MAG: hypothetical protein GYA51_06150 [Candidatus Methanofastidiosa archaeon]|nr:hypothetical protein [Candidatus Methanofastidiosa archaeon]